MAKQLEGVSERILACAKAEFLDKGYTDASLRAIAAAAETSTNSIYVRFKDKEGLFSAIVEPVLSTMLERFIHIQEDFHRMDSSVQAETMAEYAGNGTMELVNYMYDHLDEFRLLLDASYGTRFYNFVDTLAQVGTTVGQVDEILKAEEQLHAETPVSFNGYDIDVKDVSFGYHEGEEILHGVSLHIPANAMTALVGPSGSGKSTLAKLIAGFCDVKSGSITLGGHELKDIPLTQLYDQVAFVSQANYLFDESVRENIRMGRMSATDAEVEDAARAAGCAGCIDELENGYGTVVGGGGAHLSGGERQRIAIARAMLKDAPVVVLDEATAYRDPENEAVIQRAVAKLVADKTVIVIAHRLSTITGAAKSGGRVFLLTSRGYIPMFCLCGPYEAYRPQHICRECGSRSRRTRRAYPARRHW